MLLSEIFDNCLVSSTLLGANCKSSDFGNVFANYSYVGFYFHRENNAQLSSDYSIDQNRSQHKSKPCQVFFEQAKALIENLRDHSDGDGSNAKKAKSGHGDDALAIIIVPIPRFVEGKNPKEPDCAILRDFREESFWILPANEQQAMTLLLRTYKIRITPSFIIVDTRTKNTIAIDGRRALQADPFGRRFPWHLPEPIDVFRGQLLCKKRADGVDDSELVYVEELGGSIKCLLFAAHWCPPCRSFIKQLTHMCHQLKECASSSVQFEIIFCSVDRCQESFRNFYADMPWMAFPYNDPRCIAAARLYNVQEIPTLLILDSDNQLITRHGKSELNMDPDGKEFPWFPKLILELNSFTANRLREEMSFLLFTEGTPEDVTFAQTSLLPVAEEFCAKANSDQQDLLFFYCGDDAICDQVWDNLALGDASLPLICIVDPFTDSLYTCDDPNVSEIIIRRFIGKFYSGDLEPTKRFASLPASSCHGNYSLNSPQQPNINFTGNDLMQQSSLESAISGNKRLCTSVGGSDSNVRLCL